MNRAYLAAFGTLALAASGCVGEFETGGPPSTITPPAADAGTAPQEENPLDTEADTAKALFESNVRAVVSATCSPGGACHSATTPAFVSTDPLSAYDLIQANSAILFPNYLSVGAKLIENGTNNHQGALFTAADIGAIEAWLAQEKLDADAGGGVAVSAMSEWSGCMSLADWEAEGVADLWADKNANGQGNCDTCHNLGADGFMASNQDARVFEYVAGYPAFMPSYFTLNAAGTEVVINRARLESVGSQLSPHENHGAFNVDGEAMEALQRFYQKTQQRKLQGQCGPPLF